LLKRFSCISINVLAAGDQLDNQQSYFSTWSRQQKGTTRTTEWRNS